MSQLVGKVWLVGAGPGDPGLLTVKGARLLAAADVVVYDYLANPRLLDHAPAAQKVYVGKKAASHSFTQDEINATLVSLAREGKKVVRLKGGDPFVFGRGGEECLALRDAGLHFEVVPGITAAIGGPAYAGIPVTHRDFNSSFTFITGHEKEEEYKDDAARAREAASGSSDLDWSVIARLPCIAFYMGVKSLPRICAKLIENGMSADTPAATIRWGTRPEQQTVAATVGTLVDEVAKAGLRPPALTIIGKVVSLRDQLNWFESRPLFGKTVVVTRTRSQASELSAQLEELGANVIEAPTIEITPPPSWESVDAALQRLWLWSQYRKTSTDGRPQGRIHGVIFTSANGVRMTRERLDAMTGDGWDSRIFADCIVAAVGSETAAACRELLNIRPDVIPALQTGESLADAMANAEMVKNHTFLLLRADIASPKMVEKLMAAGADEVIDVPVYETVPPAALPPDLLDALAAKTVDAVTFTSSSTARNFAALLGDGYKDKLAGVQIASIGPVTSQSLRDLGLPPTVEAKTFNIDGLVRALLP
jgi:uroporphyrinogen III methyltransferase/synthase